jgi:hypothetical protein
VSPYVWFMGKPPMPKVTHSINCTPRRCGTGPDLFVAFLSAIVVLAVTISAVADARNDYLIRLLKESSQFRVRAQAAISLGSVQVDLAVLEALANALTDSNPAVRAACASSLERIGDQSALPALNSALGDDEQEVRAAVKRAIVAINRRPTKTAPRVRETTVPSGPPKYYVGIGMPGSRASTVDREMLRYTKRFIEAQVGELDGVLIAKEKETPARVRSFLKSKKLDGYYLDSSVVSLEELPGGGARAVVSIIVGTYPERNMRTILQGSARVIGSAASAKNQAIEGAFRGALRQLPKVFSMGDQ